MKTVQYLAVVLSALALVDGVVAQRGGGRGEGNEDSEQPGGNRGGQRPTSTIVANPSSQAQPSPTKAESTTTKAEITTTKAETTTTKAPATSTTAPPPAAANANANQNNRTQNNNNQLKESTPNDNNNNNDANRNQKTTLNPNVIAKASQSNGNPKEGQSPSLTDDANFINFCAGQTITNGEQNEGGSCNPIPMGQIPARAKMVSTIITEPQNGAKLGADQDFKIELQTENLIAGTFTNPDNTYYAAPQQLRDGSIIGHAHVTVQDVGDNKSPPDPKKFAFFKGIDDAGNGKGLLSTTVKGGLPAGNYRICTLMSAANHQAVLMPVAQRGAQDDCIRITVNPKNDNNNNNNDKNNNGGGGRKNKGREANGRRAEGEERGGGRRARRSLHRISFAARELIV